MPIKRLGKEDRERQILLGLVEYYIKTGKPVGSNTLKEAGFEELSSATIRNYFSNLEKEGYLSQPHSSGGRLPTDLAYRVYGNAYLNFDQVTLDKNLFKTVSQTESRSVALLLQQSVEMLSNATHCAVFLSAPRFDHDFVIDIKLVALDAYRCLGILITDFGVIQTETLHLPHQMSTFAIKRIESYCQGRLSGLGMPKNLEPEEQSIAQNFYHELMVRYIVGYSNFIDADIYRTGFSQLLTYPEFQDASVLTSSLSLFENTHAMRSLLKESAPLNQLKFWIGSDLSSYTAQNSPRCSVLTIPYSINQTPVGSVGLLGPTRIPYRVLFGLLRLFSEAVSTALTKNIYKFKLNYRTPEKDTIYLSKEDRQVIGQSQRMLLEDNREKE